jgi:two-component system, NarL family, nitrate/nitrite response regulator NarL
MRNSHRNGAEMATDSTLRILVVDDHVGIRLGIQNLIDAEAPVMHCIGAAGTPAEALMQARRCQPDVVLLDVDLDGEDGLQLIPLLQRAAPCIVVVLTSLVDVRVAERAHRLGAQACVHKSAPAAELTACIVAAHARNPTRPCSTPSITGSAMS